MSKRTLILIVVAVAALAGCSALPPFTALRGSGNPVTQTFDFSDFDRLEISNAFEAEISASDSYLVEVTVDDNLVDRLLVEQQGKTVKIGLEPGTIATNAEMRARIALPDLVSLDASGATRADLAGFNSNESMRMNLSGASTVRGDMTTGDLTVDVSGASTLRLSGQGGSLRATASGASTAELSDFAVTDADVNASGASRINVNASGTLDAEASGASTVQITGNPTMGRIEESGASTISGQ